MSIIKKIWLVLICVAQTTIIGAGAAASSVDSEEMERVEQMEHAVVCYAVPEQYFDAFLSAPDVTFLEQNNFAKGVYVLDELRKSCLGYEQRGVTIRDYSIQAAWAGEDWKNEISFRLDNAFYIDYDILKKGEHVAAYLSENQIVNSVKGVRAVYFSFPSNTGISPFLWVQAEPADYIASLYEDDMAVQPLTEFANKYRMYDGRIIVNGQALTGAHYVKTRGNSASVPFRAIMEALGSTVGWDGAARTVSFTGAGEHFLWRLDEMDVYKVAADGSLQQTNFSLIAPGDSIEWGYRTIDGRTIVSDAVMDKFLSFVGAQMSVDCDAHTVIVNSK